MPGPGSGVLKLMFLLALATATATFAQTLPDSPKPKPDAQQQDRKNDSGTVISLVVKQVHEDVGHREEASQPHGHQSENHSSAMKQLRSEFRVGGLHRGDTWEQHHGAGADDEIAQHVRERAGNRVDPQFGQ